MLDHFKGDEASQWKRPKFDPLTDLHQNWNIVDVTRHAKFYRAPFRGFGPHIHAFFVPPGVTFLTLFWGFLQLATAYTPKRIFTKNTQKDFVPANDIPMTLKFPKNLHFWNQF